jgi:hypothetical protein
MSCFFLFETAVCHYVVELKIRHKYSNEDGFLLRIAGNPV